MERAAFGLLGLAILLTVAGIVAQGVKRKSPPHLTAVVQPDGPPHAEPTTPAANPAPQPASVPESEVHPPVAATKAAVAKTPPSSKNTTKASRPAGEPKGGFQLDSGRPVAVLAYEEAAAAAVREEPGREAELLRGGLLFSAPNHTAVAIEDRHDGLVKVRILGAATQGTFGWIRADQVNAR
jgi:hypothetical protein